MVSGGDSSRLADLANPLNREDIAELVRLSGLDISSSTLDRLLEALALGLPPDQLLEGIRRLANSAAAGQQQDADSSLSSLSSSIRKPPRQDKASY